MCSVQIDCALTEHFRPRATDGAGTRSTRRSGGHALLVASPKLFDDVPRTDGAPSGYRESHFAFLNRADSVFWGRVRDQLDAWYRAFPDADGDLRRRFRSDEPGQHYAAWWELYLHAVFRRLGFAVATHPDSGTTGGRPDFKLTRSGTAFLMEAATVFSGIVEDGRHGAREAEVLDALESVADPDFSLSVAFERVGASSPPKARFVRDVREWLKTLDPDVVRRESEAGADPPARSFAPAIDWEVHLRAFALSPEARGAPDHRMIGIGPASVGMVNDREKLAAKLRGKSRRYGRPGIPLVIAVLSLSSFADDDDVEEALFGSRAIQVSVTDPLTTTPVRQPDGLWQGSGGPSARHVSAVLHGSNILPQTCVGQLPRLWHHPWAAHPLTLDLPFAASRVEADRLVAHDARSDAATVLGLPAAWPGPEDPFPRHAGDGRSAG